MTINLRLSQWRYLSLSTSCGVMQSAQQCASYLGRLRDVLLPTPDLTSTLSIFASYAA